MKNLNNTLGSNLNGGLSNRLSNKISSVFFTGAALIGFSLTNTGILIMDKLLPLIDGSFMAEMLPGAEDGIKTGVTALFMAVLAIFALFNMLMLGLGVNAIKVSKKPETVKPRTGLAKFLIASGLFSLIITIITYTGAGNFMENLEMMLPELVQISFSLSFLMEVKDLKAAFGA